MTGTFPKADYWALQNELVKAIVVLYALALAPLVIGAALQSYTGIYFDMLPISAFGAGAGIMWVSIIATGMHYFFRCDKCKHGLFDHMKKDGTVFPKCRRRNCKCTHYVADKKALTKAGDKALAQEKSISDELIGALERQYKMDESDDKA